MYCRKCGAEINDSAKFCDSCGTEVIKVKQRNYTEKYKEQKSNNKQFTTEQQRRAKHPNEKNPYISAGMFAVVIAIVLCVFPWSLIGEGIGTSLPMRIVIVVFALLGDYHVTKAKQVNNLMYSQYGFRINPSAVRLVNCLAIFATVMGLFALFTYTA